VLGISPDPPETQADFREEQELPFHLLSDEDKSVAQAYGVLKEKNGKMGIERSTFLIDEEGRIRKIWNKVKPEGHTAEVLAALGGASRKAG
jgi:peroxiredoxin Q/BCP